MSTPRPPSTYSPSPRALIVFDVESDGLYGNPFAWGGCVLPRGHQNTMLRRARRLEGYEPRDPWVHKNVVPALRCSMTSPTESLFYADFMEWLREALDHCAEHCGPGNTWVMGDVTYPVEAGFLRTAVRYDASRASAMPYPLHDIATLLAAAGLDPLAPRVELVRQYAPEALRAESRLADAHDPETDAVVSARAAGIALVGLGRWPVHGRL